MNLLTRGGEINPSEAFEELINASMSEKKIKMLDIKGIFTPDEWRGLANSLNGIIIDDYMRYSNDLFIAHCEDAELYESAFSDMGADMRAVCDKIKRLTMIQASSVLERIADFWGNQNGAGIELDKWAQW